VLKKYSPIGEIAAIAKDYTDSLHRTLGHIAASATGTWWCPPPARRRRSCGEKALSPEIDQAVQARQNAASQLATAQRCCRHRGRRAEGYTAQI
jgi:AbrB family transcriptional regulator (stage V sporulation protein T)